MFINILRLCVLVLFCTVVRAEGNHDVQPTFKACPLEISCGKVNESSAICRWDEQNSCIRKYPSKCHMDVAACNERTTLSLVVGMVTNLPMSSTSQPSRELQEKLYQQWPGVEDERLADAELDNAYELYKHKTRKPKILQDSPNDILSEPPAKLNL
ncbi:uncharacterized protein LOC135432845 isoform X1 [Drosophila montana]|uniref:uncharacterized protein LOC135432845 isoform X1 n=1 Tax=Drosophila montana TaxID=40370 RepID=UPI00313EE5A9